MCPKHSKSATKGLRVYKILSYHWSKCLTDSEFSRGNHFQGDLFWPIVTVARDRLL